MLIRAAFLGVLPSITHLPPQNPDLLIPPPYKLMFFIIIKNKFSFHMIFFLIRVSPSFTPPSTHSISTLPQLHFPFISSSKQSRSPRDDSQTGQKNIYTKTRQKKSLILRLDKSAQQQEKSLKSRQESQRHTCPHC